MKSASKQRKQLRTKKTKTKTKTKTKAKTNAKATQVRKGLPVKRKQATNKRGKVKAKARQIKTALPLVPKPKAVNNKSTGATPVFLFVTKKGTPDKRYKSSKFFTKSGEPDKRYKSKVEILGVGTKEDYNKLVQPEKNKIPAYVQLPFELFSVGIHSINSVAIGRELEYNMKCFIESKGVRKELNILDFSFFLDTIENDYYEIIAEQKKDGAEISPHLIFSHTTFPEKNEWVLTLDRSTAVGADNFDFDFYFQTFIN